MKKCLFLLLVLLSQFSYAQEGTDQQLAQFYFSSGEYEKALPYCQKVFIKENSKFNFKRYYECLLKTSKEKEAEKLVKKQISQQREDFEYSIILGEFYLQHQKAKEAEKLYQSLIDDYAVSTMTVTALYESFRTSGKMELALKTLEKGRKTFKADYPLNIQFAEFYRLTGDTDKMIQEYLDLLDVQTVYLEDIQTALSQQIDFSKEDSKEFELLKEKLLNKIQKKPNDFVYAEMLIWLFLQKKLFNAAIIQAQALDKREQGDGYRLMEIGNMCLQNKNYEAARTAYKYVTDLGDGAQFYYQAEYSLLNTRYTEITQQRNYSAEEIDQTLREYEIVLARVGINRNSIEIIQELSYIEAFYGNRSEEAVKLLNEALTLSGLTNIQAAEIKMLLADILVLRDDIWESSLLYMQIDKDFKFEPIGFEAKFKNARIFYYDGDFKFAQSQLDVLKRSTTKLIANDAMKLSILITDNYGLDSNFTAMSQFAHADLLLEQHQYQQAFTLFDSIITAFPYHGLSDEILLRKSQAMQQQGKWNDAMLYLEELMKYHAQDILADDALFQMGMIYENNLMDNEKAMEMYKKILFDYRGSLYTSEARKHLRALRGDAVEEDLPSE